MTTTFRPFLCLVAVFVWFMPLAIQAQQQRTVTHTADVRDGAGSYYGMIARVFKNAEVTLLETLNGWARVNFKDKSGWIPQRLLSGSGSGSDGNGAKARFNSIFQEMATEEPVEKEISKTATPEQVAAAVKGFARKYKTRRGGKTIVDLTPKFERRINAREYRKFRKSRVSDREWRRLKRSFRLESDTLAPYNPAMDKIGWGIANMLGQDGLVDHYELQKYLNYVALVVVESSHLPEIPVQVHILDTDDITGYAVPGGFIFISKGALRLMQNEAELAGFFAHELAHITLRHGETELRNRKPRLQSSSAFEELENDLGYSDATDDDDIRVSNELSDWADDVYEYLVSGRLETYEFEADHWATVYTYRAGYDPTALEEYLQRVKDYQGDFNRDMGTLEWQGTSIEQRQMRLRSSMGKLAFRPGGKRFTQEFAGHLRTLR